MASKTPDTPLGQPRPALVITPSENLRRTSSIVALAGSTASTSRHPTLKWQSGFGQSLGTKPKANLQKHERLLSKHYQHRNHQNHIQLKSSHIMSHQHQIKIKSTSISPLFFSPSDISTFLRHRAAPVFPTPWPPVPHLGLPLPAELAAAGRGPCGHSLEVPPGNGFAPITPGR